MVWDSSDSRSSSSSMASLPMAAAEDDRMVVEELEAAEALADLAHLAMRGGDFGFSSSKRVKSESPPPPEVSEPVTLFSDLPLERTVDHPQPPEKMCPNVPTELSNAEPDCTEMNLKDAKLRNMGLLGTTGYSSPLGCGKSRRNLTEAEKEERRTRRILANRESARQTIRRRQALCEELSKKAADLTSENESLKMEMKVALNEYKMLETTNKELRDQVASAEAEEILSGPKSTSVQVTPLSAPPLFLYNHPPFTPIFWPPISQSQIPVQAPHIPQNTVLMSSNIRESCEQENLVNTNPRGTPFYILPYPWFFPHNDHETAIRSSLSNFQNNEQDETSRAVPHPEMTPQLFLPIRVKTEPSGSNEAGIPNDLNEPPEGFFQDGGNQYVGSYLDRPPSDEPSLDDSSLVKCVTSTNTVKQENAVGLDPSPCVETSSEVCRSPLGAQEMYCEPVMYSCKKSTEAVAAAEARKRRKELTKLKSLHGRQCRMHC